MSDEEPFDIERHVRVFRKIRAARTELSAKFKEDDAALKAQQELVGNAILGFLNDTNAKTIATGEGTAYWTTKIIPRADDWERFYAWVAKHMAFDAMERRIKSTFIKDYMEANEGKLPPGVSVLSERELTVRAPNK